ncbi:MAG TPA: putative baseplate assembly protein [Acidimicrobiales bacterium]|nr:putative baseplate assembly protein [Acidimicrobiales bacterium]
MSLQAPNLDDRQFQDIVDETKLLIPKYCPEWTNHNLSDPGVALIELFAWMSEMMLYRLNQVPDRYYVKFLELMGIGPYPPTAAKADLTFWLSAVLAQPVTVRAGTQVGAVGFAGDPVVFETQKDLVISPPKLIAAQTGKGGTGTGALVDAWDDLRFPGAALHCFTSQPKPVPGDALYLGFAESLAGTVLNLRVSATSPAGFGIYPTRPPRTWEAWTGEAWVTVGVHDDSTGGLNRDGDVVLLLPAEHAGLALGGVRAYWLRVVMTQTAPGEPTYQASPEIRSIEVSTLGGTTAAEHSVAYGPETLGRTNGLSGQSFLVRHPPVLPRRPAERVQVAGPRGTESWEEVEDFAGSGDADPHYVLDSSTGTVLFGPRVRYPDGSWRQHGRVPPPNCEVTMLAYRHGGGSRANVPKDTLTSLRSTVAYIDRVSNLHPALGGADAEPIADAKKRGPFSLRTSQRAVTAHDFERLAKEASTEVARVRCLEPEVVGGPVRLLVVPRVRRAAQSQALDDFALTDGLVDRISRYLEPRRLLGISVQISAPYYQGVTVATHIHAVPTANEDMITRIRSDVLALLYDWVNPLSGGPTGEGWEWDTDLNAGPLADMIGQIDGVDRVDEVLLFECDLRNAKRYGPAKEVVRLDQHSLFLSAPQPLPGLDDETTGLQRRVSPSHSVVVVR